MCKCYSLTHRKQQTIGTVNLVRAYRQNADDVAKLTTLTCSATKLIVPIFDVFSCFLKNKQCMCTTMLLFVIHVFVLNIAKRDVLIFTDDRQYLTVDFGSALNKAVLKLYPAVDEDSDVSSVCLRFSVSTSSRAVRLLTAVLDVSEDNSDDKIHQQIDTESPAITVLRGRQYVMVTAEKIKVTQLLDTATIEDIRYSNGSCEQKTACKYHIDCTMLISNLQ